MSETPPIQCSCGATAFTDIRVNSAGVMSLICFQCRAVTHYSVPVAMAEQMWEAMASEAPSLGWQKTHHVVKEVSEPEPEPVQAGYRYHGLL